MKFPFSSSSGKKVQQNLNNAHFSIDYLGKIENNLIVFGWLFDPNKLIVSANFYAQNKILSTVEIDKVLRFEREDVNTHFNLNSTSEKLGFLFQISNPVLDEPQLDISFSAAEEQLDSKSIKIQTFEQEDFLESLQNLTTNDRQAIITTLTDLKIWKKSKPEKLNQEKPKSKKSKVQFHIDNSFVFESAIFTSGWIADPDQEAHLISFSQKGKTIFKSSIEEVANISRTDVQDFLRKSEVEVPLKCGFIKAFKLENSIDASKDVEIFILNKEGEILKMVVISSKLAEIKNFKKITENIFGTFPISHEKLFEIYDNHIGPFFKELTPIWKKKKNKKVYTYGKQNQNPEVSLVVPLYGRWDFLNFQLAIFCNDTDFSKVELIYVIDDPSIADAVIGHSNAIFPIYQLPFKIVYGGENFGFAGANNLGVSEATGKYVLLMNSDVFPKKQGWISELIKQYNLYPDAGIVGPRLTYEDESLQHEGMVFEKNKFLKGFWFNIHPGKGQPKWIFNHNNTKEVPMLTGACMLMLKETYLQVNGFDEDYLQGDFEDSDLNMKVKELGLKSYLAPQVELYHLERKSQSLFNNSDWKLKLTLYNAWQHTKKWNNEIETLNKELQYA